MEGWWKVAEGLYFLGKAKIGSGGGCGGFEALTSFN
jgi:hypothetical protein